MDIFSFSAKLDFQIIKKPGKESRGSSAAERLPLAEGPGSNPGRGVFIQTEFFIFSTIRLRFTQYFSSRFEKSDYTQKIGKV